MTEPQAHLSTEIPSQEVPSSHPMPRLGRGNCWSNVVAEIERDNRARLHDAEAS